MKNISAAGCALLVLLALPANEAVAEDRTAGPDSEPMATLDGVFIDTVDVSVVNVDAFVTDKKGNRVLGLTADDFELFQNGKPVTITNFYAVEQGKVVAGAMDLPVLDDPLEAEVLGDHSAVPEDQRLSLIVYIDNLNLHPFSRNRAFGFIRTFLRTRVQRGDRVMLVTYERSLHERVPFTRDPELIASTLYDLEDKSAHAIHKDSDRRDLLESIFEAERIYEVRGRVQTYAENRFNDLTFTLRALREMVERLAGLPGRKAILYVSDGLAMRAGEDLYYALQERFQDTSMLMEAFRYDLTRDYQQLTRLANTNRVTFYTLDAEGLRTYSYYDVRNRNPGGGSIVDQQYFANLQAPLQLMADETGGFAMINTNNFTKPLDKMGDDFDSYYSLGYSPVGSGSGSFNRLRVEVKGRKDLVVRSREGFRDKPMSTRMSDGTLAALYHGYQKNGLGVAIEVGRQASRGDGHFDVPLKIKVPLKNLAFVPQAELHRGRIRLYIAARDSDGGMSEVQDLDVPIDIPSERFESAREQSYEYVVTMMMRGGSQLLAVGVHDQIGAATAFVSTGINVGR